MAKPKEVRELQKQKNQSSPGRASGKWQDPGEVLAERLVQTHGEPHMPCVKWPNDSCVPDSTVQVVNRAAGARGLGRCMASHLGTWPSPYRMMDTPKLPI